MNSLRAAIPDRSLVTLLAALVLLLSSAATAHAQGEAPPPASISLFGGGAAAFGASGQAAFTMTSQGDFPFSFSKTGGGSWSLHLVPSLDYFIQEHLSVGGLVGIDKDGGGSTVRFGARVGYDIPLGSLVSMWPRGGLQVAHASPNNGPGVTVTTLGIELPFVFHFVPHFLLGVGPFFSVPLTNSAAMGSKDSTFGLTALVGGYF